MAKKRVRNTESVRARFTDDSGVVISGQQYAALHGETRRANRRRIQGVTILEGTPANNAFDKIRSLDSKIPGARTKKLRPEPHQSVLCPICRVQAPYQDLFDHVTKRHPEQNAKIVLAKFNREYEIWAKNSSRWEKSR